MSQHKLSLTSAIFININIMLGSGIFINSTILASKAGALGGFCYLLVGLLMLPLIIAISKLVELHPAGGFYTFASKEIHPYAGFFSAWSYAVGKLASAVIITQFAVMLTQQVIPALAQFDTLALNAFIMLLFILLNMFDIKTGSSIQKVFFAAKMIPILFAIFTGLYLFSWSNVPVHAINYADLPITLPLVLFAMAGFEAACSLSSRIENPQVNGPKAIFISYGLVIAATTLFQLLIYGALGSALAAMPDYRYLFPGLVAGLLPDQTALGNHLINIIHLAIASSALGGSYGVIFSNNWNFFTLASHNHLFFSEKFVQLNRYHIPWLCVLLEGLIYFVFLFVSRGSQIPLQQMGALGPTIGYSLSAFALLCASYKFTNRIAIRAISVLSLFSCSLLFTAAIYSLFKYGVSTLSFFALLMAFGTVMFLMTKGSSNFDSNQSKQA